MPKPHFEIHYADRIGWLRAAVLGANDGILSTSSLVVGVAAASAVRSNVLIAGVAGLMAGAMAMAAGEYVSVSSQADTEKADLAREKMELETDYESERHELAGIYQKRGLDPVLAMKVADQLMDHDALMAHARDELGLNEIHTARPLQAAFASALTFAGGAALPLLVVLFAPTNLMIPLVAVCALFFLALMGFMGAYLGGANVWVGALRVTFWGLLAMLTTALVGKLFGTNVGG
jgi:vacuolar iron transporter family protein